MRPGRADAQTLSRWTPLQRSDGVTVGENGRSGKLEDPTRLWHWPPSQAHKLHTVPALVTKVRNFTLGLSGCRTGGEEDRGW